MQLINITRLIRHSFTTSDSCSCIVHALFVAAFQWVKNASPRANTPGNDVFCRQQHDVIKIFKSAPYARKRTAATSHGKMRT
jgi:hypothetical protein